MPLPKVKPGVAIGLEPNLGVAAVRVRIVEIGVKAGCTLPFRKNALAYCGSYRPRKTSPSVFWRRKDRSDCRYTPQAAVNCCDGYGLAINSPEQIPPAGCNFLENVALRRRVMRNSLPVKFHHPFEKQLGICLSERARRARLRQDKAEVL